MRRHAMKPFAPDPDDALTFTDVTVLVFLAVSTLAVAAVLLLGTVSAVHRIAGALAGI